MKLSVVCNQTPPIALCLIAVFLFTFAFNSLATSDTSIVVVMDETTPLLKCLHETGATCHSVSTPLEGLTNQTARLLIVDASPDNLRILSEAPDELKAFTGTGGWIILCGLFPDGLEFFNKIVGVDHLLRSFSMEEVLLAQPADPLLKGLRSSDLFFESGEWSDDPNAIPLRSGNFFTYVVDYDNVAPFSMLPNLDHWGIAKAAPGSEQWPPNMVNGLTYHRDFGFAIDLAGKQPNRWTMTFPRQENVVGFSWTPDNVYNMVKEVSLDFGDGDDPVVVKIASPGAPAQTTFAPRATRQLTVEIRKWEKRGSTDIVAVRNIGIKVEREKDFYDKVKPLFSVGGMVKYPMGKGGVILNQLHILEKESSPVNGEKKRHIAHTILNNLLEPK